MKRALVCVLYLMFYVGVMAAWILLTAMLAATCWLIPRKRSQCPDVVCGTPHLRR